MRLDKTSLLIINSLGTIQTLAGTPTRRMAAPFQVVLVAMVLSTMILLLLQVVDAGNAMVLTSKLTIKIMVQQHPTALLVIRLISPRMQQEWMKIVESIITGS